MQASSNNFLFFLLDIHYTVSSVRMLFFDLVKQEQGLTRDFYFRFFRESAYTYKLTTKPVFKLQSVSLSTLTTAASLSLVSMTQAQAVNWVNVNLRKDEITWARICKRLWSPGIDFEESIPPAYAAWWAGTTNRNAVPGWESIPGLLQRFTNTGSVLLTPDVYLLWNCRWPKFTACIRRHRWTQFWFENIFANFQRNS